ncbi:MULTISPECIES: Hsp20/alpha crystallin family protein [unclassified Caballeronia]|uniref:Hsp20/alpha crystallin family protein n=1 Tax=unclassified Caballeronia TaxID=2646786 RepID=UPI001F34E07C|nr:MULTISPECIES: Hsp20/alpha crystallin family protein [unclassified Caballeronia]MCE4547542.1 Hsp20/alpha crystallin family protein [Caballeronia sp. PC1]MCE4575000.1 Hsp20/alpha crystallin family protein [Caballeronia sp. CLC5]
MNENTQVAQRDEDAVTRAQSDEARRRATLTPTVDIFEDAHGVTLWADVPGVSKEKLEIKTHDGRLTIEAESVVAVPPNLRLSHAELRAPFFSRSFTVSDDFDTSRIDAVLRDGVLKLSIPRREEAKPRKIEVRVG